MGRHPLPKASRTCWKAFVFYFMERLVGGISRSDSWGILVFLDFSVIWAPHHQGGGSTSSPNPVIFQKIKKCVILKTWKTKSGYCSKSNLEYARTLVLKGESRREEERAGESPQKDPSWSPSCQDSSNPIAIWNTTIHAKWHGARDSTHQFL